MSEATNPRPTQRLGDFEIVREVGRGGMGVVYEARQTSLNRKVALKVLSGGLGLTPQAVARFRREAEAAAKLHHTNIVPIYAIGEADSTHYYAMELVEGPSLNVVIHQLRSEPRASARADGSVSECPEEALGAEAQTTATTPLPDCVAQTITSTAPQAPQPPPETIVGESSTTLTAAGGYFDNVARMIAEVADALDYAREQGVIHRDIKPSNLLLSPAGRLSINDFGLARILEQPGMTTTGEFMGSPLYMSPEQITAGRTPLDHRTDIYSLGATLYELLTFDPPFPGERRDQILAQIIHKEPKPPRRINRKVPVDLETICLKAIEKDPDRRYQTAGQMADDLRKYLNRYAISAKRAGPITRVAKWVRRRPAVAALLGAVVVLGAFAGVLAYSAHLSNVRVVEMQRQQAIDDALLAAMSGEFDRAQAAIERAELLRVDLGWVRMLQGHLALQQGRAHQAVADLEQAVRLLPNSVAAQAMLARACREDGRWERYYAVAEALAQAAPSTAEDYLFKGAVEVDLDPVRALQDLDAAVRLRKSPLAQVIRAEARLEKAMMTGDVRDAELAIEDAAAAKAILPDNQLALRTHLYAELVAANVFDEAGDAARRRLALAEAERDAEALERFAGVAEAHRARACYFEQMGQNEAVLEEYRSPGVNPLDYVEKALYRRGSFAEAFEMLEGSAGCYRDAGAYVARVAILAELPDGYRRALQACRDSTGSAAGSFWALDPPSMLCFLGRPLDAVAAARKNRASIDETAPWVREWYSRIADYQCEAISAEDLLEVAGADRRRQCEAHFEIALRLLGEGDRAGAKDHFAKSVETRVFDYFEYIWSRNFLTRFEQAPTWPPWIPLKMDATTQPVEQGPLGE